MCDISSFCVWRYEYINKWINYLTSLSLSAITECVVKKQLRPSSFMNVIFTICTRCLKKPTPTSKQIIRRHAAYCVLHLKLTNTTQKLFRRWQQLSAVTGSAENAGPKIRDSKMTGEVPRLQKFCRRNCWVFAASRKSKRQLTAESAEYCRTRDASRLPSRVRCSSSKETRSLLTVGYLQLGREVAQWSASLWNFGHQTHHVVSATTWCMQGRSKTELLYCDRYFRGYRQ